MGPDIPEMLREGAVGKEHPPPSPPSLWCCDTEPPGLAPRWHRSARGSWSRAAAGCWVCVSNVKGMSHFLEKNDRLDKKQITRTAEKGLSSGLRLAVNFNQASGSHEPSQVCSPWMGSPTLCRDPAFFGKLLLSISRVKVLISWDKTGQGVLSLLLLQPELVGTESSSGCAPCSAPHRAPCAPAAPSFSSRHQECDVGSPMQQEKWGSVQTHSVTGPGSGGTCSFLKSSRAEQRGSHDAPLPAANIWDCRLAPARGAGEDAKRRLSELASGR